MKKDKNIKNALIILVVLLLLRLILWIVTTNLQNKEENKKELDYKENEKKIESEINNNYLDNIIQNFPKKNDSKITGDIIHNIFKNDERQSKKFTFYSNDFKFIYNYKDGSVDESTIKIYKKNNNKLVYSNDYIKTFIVSEDGDFYNFLPTIKDNKLHLLIYNPNKCYLNKEQEKVPYFEYIEINLTNLNERTIESVKLEIADKFIPNGYFPDCK